MHVFLYILLNISVYFVLLVIPRYEKLSAVLGTQMSFFSNNKDVIRFSGSSSFFECNFLTVYIYIYIYIYI